MSVCLYIPQLLIVKDQVHMTAAA